MMVEVIKKEAKAREALEKSKKVVKIEPMTVTVGLPLMAEAPSAAPLTVEELAAKKQKMGFNEFASQKLLAWQKLKMKAIYEEEKAAGAVCKTPTPIKIGEGTGGQKRSVKKTVSKVGSEMDEFIDSNFFEGDTDYGLPEDGQIDDASQEETRHLRSLWVELSTLMLVKWAKPYHLY